MAVTVGEPKSKRFDIDDRDRRKATIFLSHVGILPNRIDRIFVQHTRK